MHLRTMKRFLLIAMVLFVPFAKAQAVEPVHVVIIGDNLCVKAVINKRFPDNPRLPVM